MRNTSLKRLSGYGVAVAAVLGSTSANGTIIHLDVNPPDQTGSDTNNNAVLLSFSLTGVIATNGTHVASEQFYATHTHSTSGGSNKLHFYGTFGFAAFDSVPRNFNDTIGLGQTSNPASTGAVLNGFWGSNPKGNWSLGQTAYMGLRFDNGGVPNYGWAYLTVVDEHTITLRDFAYEDSGSNINAGVVPEPSQIALFAIGAAGIAAYRRRKQNLAAAN